MHISLDSALGRQRRLNSVGESITQIAPDPAAAYSLRSLTGSDPKVVRVRRESDNDEQDFTASEVSSGALVDYVNAQVTKPLDVRELQSDGRTGDFVIAKAAYSLRSLGDRQATTAQGDVPLDEDTVQAPSGKYVVQVRRSSDNKVKSFTADEVADGTLLDFVNEDVITEQSDFTSGVDSYARDSFGTVSREASFEGKSDVLKYEFASSGRFGIDKTSVALAKTSSYTISFEYYADSEYNGNFWGVETSFASRVSASSNSPTVVSGAWTSVTLNVPSGRATGTAQLHIRIQDTADGTLGVTGITANVRFKNIVVTQTTGSGFVRAWYDQSVSNQAGTLPTGNHAIQSTAANQPTIVSNGSLVADNGIDFDNSSEHFLVATSVSGMEAKLSVFSTSVRDSTGHTVSLSNSSSNSKYFAIQEGGSNSVLNTRNTTSVTASPSVSGSTRLTFGLTTGDTVTSAGALGGALTTDTTDYGSAFGSGDLDQIVIGTLRTVSPDASHFFDGRIREILVYASSATGDQTDNRGAFEANIAEHYGISGIPAEDNQVNGFVETWYDQSGNSRDITQTTADNQPKIVSSGALVTATNNLPAIDFTTSVTRLVRTEFLTGQLSTYFSTYQGEAGDSAETQVVVRQGANYRISNSIQTSGKIRAQLRDGGGDAVNLDAGGDLATGSPLLQTTLIGARGANGLTVFVNGASEANGDTSDIEDTDFAAADSGDFAIGAIYNSNSFDFVGKGQEFIFYHSNLSSDRTVIESNINNHYSIF